MMQNKAPKKSFWFLTVVAIFTTIIGSGYLLPSFVPAMAMNSGEVTPSNDSHEMQNADSQESESLFSVIEKWVAENTHQILDSVFGNFITLNQENSEDSFKEDKKENKSQNEDNNSLENSQKSLDTPVFIEVITGHQLATWYPFQDIEDSAFKYSILIGYSNGLFQNNTNFYPENYVRISDFIRVVVDTYRLKKQINPSTLEGLTERNYFPYSTLSNDILRRINSAYELWLFQNLEFMTLGNDQRLSRFITPKQAQLILKNLEKKDADIVKNSDLSLFSSKKDKLLKEELAEILVQSFHLTMNTDTIPAFSDISGTTYQKAIQALADRWIISGENGSFNPTSLVKNKDFVSMLIKAIMSKQNTPLQLSNFYYLNNLPNVSTDSTYAPYLEYCLDTQVCNSLLSQRSSWVYFQADKTVTWGEIEKVLSDITQIKFWIPEDRRDKSLSRGELAYLIYTMLWFDLDNDELVNKGTSLSIPEKIKQKLANRDTTSSKTWNTSLEATNENSEQGLRYDLRNFMKIS